MKRERLLFLSGMTRQAYDNFDRRGHLRFLKRTRFEGVDRFEYGHALALAAFWRFREMGMDPQRIAEVISYPDHWRAICDIARGDTAIVQRIGVAFDNKGRLVHEGDRRSDCAGQPDLAGAFVDLGQLDADLRAQLSAEECVTGLMSDAPEVDG